MGDLLSPRELRIRKVRSYLRLDENMPGRKVYAHCAQEMNVSEPFDTARVDFDNETNIALDIDPAYFTYYYTLALQFEKKLALAE